MKNITWLFVLFFAFTGFYSTFAQIPNIAWDKTIGSSGEDKAYAVVSTTDGGLVVVGYSLEADISGDKSENSKGFDDYWIVKLNADGQKVWDRTIGGNGSEIARAVVATTDGGFVVAGDSNSGISGDKSENSRGDTDYWIVKLNANGQKVWDKTFGGSSDDYATSIITTPDGGFVVAGYSYSDTSGDKTENMRRGPLLRPDYWVVRLNASGQKIWDKTLGGYDYDYAYGVVATSDGGFIIAGSSESGISAEKSENSRGSNDAWIIKIDANGQKVWDKTFGGSSHDGATAIMASSDGGFIITGVSNSGISGDKTETNRGASDYWIIKINNSGQKIWDKSMGGDDDDACYSTALTPDNGYLITGFSFSNISGDKSENRRGSSDYWVVKLDANGQKAWDKTIGGSHIEALYGISVQALPDGGFVIASNSRSNISGEKTENSKGGYDYWIVRLAGPCPSLLTLTPVSDNIAVGNVTKKASAINGKIQASNQITGTANVIYQAKSIELIPNFKADTGAVFKAEIGGCN